MDYDSTYKEPDKGAQMPSGSKLPPPPPPKKE